MNLMFIYSDAHSKYSLKMVDLFLKHFKNFP